VLATLESGALAGGNGNTRTLGNPQGCGNRLSELTVGSQQFKTKKSQTQDPGSQVEPGAPAAYFWFRTQCGMEIVDRVELKRRRQLSPAHPPTLIGFSEIRGTLLEGMAGTTGLEPAASAVTVPSWTLHITHLHVDSEFVIVAEVNDVVAAVAGAAGTTQALSMDRKQK
jgi:hypothetical protein